MSDTEGTPAERMVQWISLCEQSSATGEATDIMEEALAELAKRDEPLITPTETARAVFRKFLEQNPNADMRAVPNQWVINARALADEIAEDKQ